jgi:hypothetical protein
MRKYCSVKQLVSLYNPQSSLTNSQFFSVTTLRSPRLRGKSHCSYLLFYTFQFRSARERRLFASASLMNSSLTGSNFIGRCKIQAIDAA